MKKEFKIAIAVILAIWIFIIGMEVGVYKEKKSAAENTTAAAPTVSTPAEPATQPTEPVAPSEPSAPVLEPSEVPSEPSAPAVEPSVPAANTDVSDVQPSDAPADVPAPGGDDLASLTNDQILERVTKYVNQVKAEQNMTANKKENITVNLTDLSAPSLKSLVQGIIDNLAGAEEKTFTFSGGQAADGDGTVTPNDVIPPTHKSFSLTAAGVASAKAEKVGDNTVYTVVLVEESTTLESPEPTHNAVAIGYLNLAGIDLPSIVTLTKADMKYPGSTVSVTVDANDKVIGLKNELPMTGAGEAKAGLTGSASFEGALNEEWTFTY